MKAWLSGDHKYVKVIIGPKLRRHLATSDGDDVLRRMLVRQVRENLGAAPTSWKWEEEGVATFAYLDAGGRPVVVVRRNIVIGAAAPTNGDRGVVAV